MQHTAAMTDLELLAYYSTPGVFTSLSGFEEELSPIPDDPAGIAEAVQGLLVHTAFGPMYQVALTDEQQSGAQLHGSGAMLRRIQQLDPAPICESRNPASRLGAVCRHFAALTVAIMRHKGIPARTRCGFSRYFQPGKHLDHWVTEYWDAPRVSWVLLDSQVDQLQRSVFKLPFDPLDVPRDQFLVAGDAYRLCRSGKADPMTFGVAGTENWGLLEVIGDVMQDLASLQKVELLPWGWYGIALDEAARLEELDLFDHLAAISSAGDAAALEDLRTWIASDPRLGVPAESIEEILQREA